MNGDDDAVPLLRRRRELYDSDSDSDGDDDDVSDVDTVTSGAVYLLNSRDVLGMRMIWIMMLMTKTIIT